MTVSRGIRKTYAPRADQKALSAGGEMKCPRCQKTKSLDQFPKRSKKHKGRVRYSYCTDCAGIYNRGIRLVTSYGITTVEYENILAYQGGVCAICKRPPGENRLAVDHRHSDALTRGLLCWQCNKSLAYMRDEARRAAAMAEYLNNPPAVIALGREAFGRTGRVSRKWRSKTERREHMARVKAKKKEERLWFSR